MSKWRKIRREEGVSKRKAKRLAYPYRLRKKHYGRKHGRQVKT